MKFNKLFGLGIVFILLLSGVSHLILSANNYNYGAGFGRELLIISEDVETSSNFVQFQQRVSQNNAELEVIDLKDGYSLIKIEGVGDMERILTYYTRYMSDRPILNSGTFGSISNISYTILSMQMYMVLFFGITIALWTYRYRLLGFFMSLVMTIFILTPVYFGKELNFYLNGNSWFIILCYVLMLLNLMLWLMNRILEKESSKLLARNVWIIAVNTLLLGGLFYLLDDSVISISIVLYLVFQGLFLVVFAFVLWFGLDYFYLYYLNDSSYGRLFLKRSGINAPFFLSNKIAVFAVGLLILFVTIIFGTIQSETTPHSSGFSQESILVVNKNDVSSFLEVQGSLGRYGLMDYVIEYNISEEMETWFIFDSLTDQTMLRAVKDDIDIKLDSVSQVYATNLETFLFESYVFDFLIMMSVLVLAIVMYLIRSKVHALQYIVLTIGSYIFLYLFVNIYKVPVSVPMISMIRFNLIYSFMIVQISEDLFTETGILNFVSRNATILVLIYLPILLFVSTNFSFVVESTVLLMLSITSMLIFGWMMRRIVGYGRI